ncbi:MAG: hypothetical protein AABY22_01050 [Nanoarchaeota archaeon]
MKKIITLILGIFLLNLVSAQISLNPTTFNIPAMPGETHYRNITINTDGDYAVYLNSSAAEGNITINYSSPLIVEKSKIIAVSFFFPKDIAPGVYNIQLNATTEVYESPAPVASVSSSGGGSFVYVLPNGTLTYKKPKNISMENDTIIDNLIEQIIDKETIKVGPEKPTIKQVSRWAITGIIMGLGILGICGIIYLIVRLLIKSRKTNNEK